MPTKKQIDQAVAEVCANIIQEPLLYFSEADFQQLLTEQLRQAPGLKRPAKTGVHKGTGSSSFYSTSLVHREYGSADNKRTDIVVFHRKDVEKIKRTNLDFGPKDYLKPQFAFELGTEKTTDVEKHLDNDLKKVAKATDFGYVIHIYRDTTQSTSSGLRNKTEAKIRDSFREPVQGVWPKPQENTRILAILLRTERATKKMRGKCEICFGPSGTDWQKINVSNRDGIVDAVKTVLE